MVVMVAKVEMVERVVAERVVAKVEAVMAVEREEGM